MSTLSTLKRGLSQYILKRNETDVDLPDVERLIENELDDPGSISGYRGMWHTLHVKYAGFLLRAGNRLFLLAVQVNVTGCFTETRIYRNYPMNVRLFKGEIPLRL